MPELVEVKIKVNLEIDVKYSLNDFCLTKILPDHFDNRAFLPSLDIVTSVDFKMPSLPVPHHNFYSQE